MSTLKVNKIENTATTDGGVAIDSSGLTTVSTLKVTTLADSSGSNTSTPADIASGRAKAWVNFNGTGTVAIRTSFNIASITDNGTGDYTLTFTTAMTDANYAVVGMTAESGNPNRAMAQRTDSTIVNTSVRVGTFSTSGDVVADLAHNSVVVFR